MTCPVCPCPTCVAARQTYPGFYPPAPFKPWNAGMWRCASCGGWYSNGTGHMCGGGWGGGDKSPPIVTPL